MRVVWRAIKLLFGVAVVCLIGFVVFTAFLVDRTLDRAEAKECGDPILAYVMTQEPVKAQIRSPSTATFPAYAAAGVDVSRADVCEFLVRSYVDAQNGFEATVRATYLADVIHHPEDRTWSIRNVRMQDY